MAERDQYIRISEAVAQLRAAGYDDSEWTVRRMADAGVLRSYKLQPSGHRRISVASIKELIAGRSNESSGGADGEEDRPAPAGQQDDPSP